MNWFDRLIGSFKRPGAEASRERVAASPWAGYPDTALPPPGHELDPDRLIFDPALKEFPHAFRTEAPGKLSGEQTAIYDEASGRSMAHLLELISRSTLSQHLALRGSSTMPFWVGSLARTPKDLDFVVLPDSEGINGKVSKRIFTEIPSLLASRPCPGLETLGPPLLSPIWTYDRVPGRRLVFRWQTDDDIWGTTQMDFVFGETLFDPPQHVEGLTIGVCGPTLSLAWKLCWLASDIHPQAKDLYDAMVLAEAYPPSEADIALIRKVYLDNLGVTKWGWREFSDRGMEWAGIEQAAEAERVELAKAWFGRLKDALPDWTQLTK